MIEQMRANGVDPASVFPELADPPQLAFGLEWFLQAFQELSCDRQIGFGPGPIPSWAIRSFARDHGLDDEETADLSYVIRKLDEVFLEHAAEQSEAAKEK